MTRPSNNAPLRLYSRGPRQIVPEDTGHTFHNSYPSHVARKKKFRFIFLVSHYLYMIIILKTVKENKHIFPNLFLSSFNYINIIVQFTREDKC